jgi:hypothetical protein
MSSSDENFQPPPVTLEVTVDEPDTPAGFVREALGALEQRQRFDARTRVEAPWRSVGAALRGGLRPGVHLLFGNPGSGRTQLAFEWAVHAAGAGAGVVVIAPSLDRDAAAARLLGAQTKLPWGDILLGELTEKRWERVRTAVDTVAELPLHVEAGRPLDAAAHGLGPLCASVRREGKPMLIIIDDLALSAGLAAPEAAQLAFVRSAADVARGHDAVLLLVSRTARGHFDKMVAPRSVQAPKRADATALLGLGAEPDGVLDLADTVMALVRAPDGDGDDWLALAKHRYGAASWTSLYFTGSAFQER